MKVYDKLKKLHFGEKVINKLIILYTDFMNFGNNRKIN